MSFLGQAAVGQQGTLGVLIDTFVPIFGQQLTMLQGIAASGAVLSKQRNLIYVTDELQDLVA